MKKRLLLALIMVLVVGSLGSFSPRAASATTITTDLSSGTLIKGTTNPTIYYLAEDGKRYVFPNANIFFSWYDNFNNVTVVSDDTLASYPLGGNVHYKPGNLLVKIQTDPKVYLVTNHGTLRWVKTEALAKSLYGDNWNKLIDDLPDSFFTNYTVGQAITSENEINLLDLEEEYPGISYNLGLKAKIKVISKQLNQAEKKCQQLEKEVNTLQKRLARWNMTLGNIGNDFVTECVQKNITTPIVHKGKDKIAVCHQADGKSNNIVIASAALKAHLAHGDYLGECTGSDSHDRTKPVISAVNSAASCASAAITWTTNEAATSKVYYSTSPLASSTNIILASEGSLVTAHSIALTGLATSTKYYYKVESKDAAGNTAKSSEANFTTSTVCTDTIAPVISAVSSTAGCQSAVITWTTNEAANSKIYYATTGLDTATVINTAVNNNLVTSHSLELTGLATSTKYYFKVESADAAGNKATGSETYFTTQAACADIIAPVISAVNGTASCQGATITWTTSEPATGKVYYATDALASSTSIATLTNSNLTTAHTMQITGLATSTKYYFKVESADAAGNKATGSETYFTTLAVCADVTAPAISALSATASTTSATVAWTTDEPATSKVYYSLTNLATSSAITTLQFVNLVTSHSIEITGLATSTKYYYKVESRDTAGNTATSDESSFTTFAPAE